ncbi:hypothetical protein D3C81_2196290 [compost metagenome]
MLNTATDTMISLVRFSRKNERTMPHRHSVPKIVSGMRRKTTTGIAVRKKLQNMP